MTRGARCIALICKAALAALLLTVTYPLSTAANPASINLRWIHGSAGGV